MKLVEKAKTMVTDIGTYWNKPKEGEYVSNKEFTKFVVGAGFANCAGQTGGSINFTAGCLFVGAIYGLKMMDFAMLGFVSLILNYLFSPIGMIITDNLGSPPKKTLRFINWANVVFAIVGVACFFIPQRLFEGFMPALPQVVGSKFLLQVFNTYWMMFVLRKLSPKYGKYRSWCIAGILPYIAVMFLLVFFPYNRLAYHDKFWVMHLLFTFWGFFGSCFGQVANLQNVISPNSAERTKVMSFGSFLYSLFPSLYSIFLPVLATMVGGMTDIRTYQIVIPIMTVIAAPLSLFLVFGVKDRVVQEQEHKPQVNMMQGFKEVLRNKYLWITNIGGWIGSFSAGAINIVNMLIIYSLRQDWVMGLMVAILGTAYTPGMLLSPILLKKFGKKKVMLCARYISVAASLLAIGGVYLNSLVLVVALTYLSTMLTSVHSIAGSSMTADIWDYQQYISGERLDGCMGIFGYLSSPVTTAAALIIPFLYGLIGFTADWNILYDTTLRTQVLMITIIASSITGFLSIIPYHFYDLTEKRHKEIIEELSQRALEKEQAAQLAQGPVAAAVTEGGNNNEN